MDANNVKPMTDQPTDQELNIAIARVMGLVEGVDFGDWESHSAEFNPFCRRCGAWAWGQTEFNRKCHRPPPAYAEDMGLIANVGVQLAKERGWVISYEWVKSHSEWLGSVQFDGHFLMDGFFATADTAPRALCLAIWEALGGEKED